MHLVLFQSMGVNYNIIKEDSCVRTMLMEKLFHQLRVLTLQGLSMCSPQDVDIWCQILFECHDSPSAGHRGIRKTYAHVKQHFF